MAQQLASCLVCAILFLCLARHHATSLVSQFGNETDRQSLLSLKSMLSDDSRQSLASWNDSIHFCHWPGVVCGKRHPQRVISLVLVSLGLSGSMSPAIANLTFLRKMDLSDNQLLGPIPRDIGRLLRLHHLNLSHNSLEGGIPATLSSCAHLQNISICCNMLTGEIPPGLSNCSDLRLIHLSKNSLTGHIPPALATLSSLTHLSLGINQLSGIIPSTLWNLTSLVILSLGGNPLSGKISPSIGKLSKLKILDLCRNQLTGAIPSELWNLSSLSLLQACSNNLSGLLPTNVGELLPLIEIIRLYHNQLSGPIPMSLSNASHLESIDLSENMFRGTIPPIFGSLQNLEWLNLFGNVLEAPDADGWRFIDSLSNCSNLVVMSLDENNLGGVLPHSIANLSTNLRWLTMRNNNISGNIPPDIGNLVSLTSLWLTRNFLRGSIPTTVGMLQNMHILDLYSNMMSGEIPSTLGNLTQLVELYLDYNKLSGAIPASLGNCQNLDLLNLQMNNLSGWIPKEILSISTLSLGLFLSFNSLTGQIPSEVGALKNLGILDVSMNRFFGEIPSSIGECKELEQLSFRGNLFQGSIPPSLSGLRGIQILDLSQNNFSGRVPDFLQDFHFLINLNLSFNNFEGEVPRHGIFLNTSAVSLLGNKNLCGGIPEVHLPDCQLQSPSKKHDSHQLMLIISIACSSLFFFLLFCFLVACFGMGKFRKKHSASTAMNEQENVSYADLVRATNGFSEDHKIGSGGFATVYKGILHDDDDERRKVVAVKVLNLRLQGALKSFMAECEALRNIRHRNLVKVITACSSIDFRGDEFKALVLEFMANRSLDDWLHPKENERTMLTPVQRLDISIDVATALDYLHNYSESPIIHCDLKPSNVLLHEDMTAHVGDFGLARILKNVAGKSPQHSTSSVGLKGTIGYVPPEYGMANRVSPQGDVYSYGILLLEMFTGKSPTDGIFSEGQSLRKSVKTVLPQRVTDVIDLQLLSVGDGEITDNGQSMNAAGAIECIASVLQIGIMCSNESPAERLEMGQVIRELHKIRECFLKKLNPRSRVEG